MNNINKQAMRNFKCTFIIILGFISLHIAAENSLITSNFSDLKPFHGGGHSHIYEVNTRYNLYQLCSSDIEGFNEKISGRDYTYQSIREDVTDALIARASDGKLGFEIRLNKIPKNYTKNEVSFFFNSNIDLNIREAFDVFVNDSLVLSFKANEDGTLDILNNPADADVEYFLVERDDNKDGKGAFRLTVPTSLIGKGNQGIMKVLGQKKGSRSWFMIFKTNDVIERLRISTLNEAAFSIKQNEDMLYIDAPAHFDGKTVYIQSDYVFSEKTVFKKQGNLAKASIKIKVPKENFKLFYGYEFVEVNFENKQGTCLLSDVVGSYFYHYNIQNNGSWMADITKLYKPSLFSSYTNFFDKKYENGTVSILNSSHQDIAWVDRPEVCIILRDTLLLTPVINDAFTREDYAFDIEDGLMLREYIERHPESKEKITTLLNKKLISVGASYNCPYEDMYDAEDLVRQFYLGKKWVKKTFGGYDSRVYWNVDVPGKTLQFPQILKKAGVDYMIISRHAKGMFYWESPDGSSVFTYSPGHYGDDYSQLSKNLTNKMKYGAKQVNYWSRYFQNSTTTTPLLSSYDMIPAIDYTDYIKAWNGFKKVKDYKKEEIPVYLPKMDVKTSDEFMPLAEKNAKYIKTIKGERPNVWVYIHGPAHHEAITASREASKILPAAETFLSVANTLNPTKVPYPFKDFDEAWQAKIYPDHGWGGHDGDITDNLFKAQLVKSKNLGEKLLDKGTNFIASNIRTNEGIGTPVVLFNSLSWERTDPVTVAVNFQKGEAKSVEVITSTKENVVSQLANTTYFDDGSIKSSEVVFIAKKIPSIGYKTYYIKPLKQEADKEINENISISNYENNAYKITFEKGGIAQIFDKALQRNLFKTNTFKAGEVFTLESNGNGAGEFGDIQQPFMEDFDKVSLHNPEWEIIANGSVYTTYRLKQPILHTTVQQDVTMYHDLKRVLFETKLLNWEGVLYREFRTAFPVAIDSALVTHEVPFGSVKVGQDEIETAGNRYTALSKNVHPRAITDWFSASDDDMTVTLSSSVAAIDWIDPTSDGTDTILQHVLLASRTSCHWEGNEYSQAGTHSYHNILTSNKTGEISGQRVAKQHNTPLHVVVNPVKSIDAFLQDTASFFNIDKDNVIVTTIKKAEDSDELVIRIFDTEGENSIVDLKSYFKINDLQKTNIIEEHPVPVKDLKVSKFGIETFTFKPKN
jgi:alpha-mannosidase